MAELQAKNQDLEHRLDLLRAQIEDLNRTILEDTKGEELLECEKKYSDLKVKYVQLKDNIIGRETQLNDTIQLLNTSIHDKDEIIEQQHRSLKTLEKL